MRESTEGFRGGLELVFRRTYQDKTTKMRIRERRVMDIMTQQQML